MRCSYFCFACGLASPDFASPPLLASVVAFLLSSRVVDVAASFGDVVLPADWGTFPPAPGVRPALVASALDDLRSLVIVDVPAFALGDSLAVAVAGTLPPLVLVPGIVPALLAAADSFRTSLRVVAAAVPPGGPALLSPGFSSAPSESVQIAPSHVAIANLAKRLELNLE